MIVTLCGSTRFEAEFITAQRELSRRGINFFSLAVLPCHRATEEGWKDGEWNKTIADLLYYDRILHSDAIIVLGDGYIGQSTSREIIWAWIQEKKILQRCIGDDWDMTTRGLRSSGVSSSRKLLIEEAKRMLGADI